MGVEDLKNELEGEELGAHGMRLQVAFAEETDDWFPSDR